MPKPAALAELAMEAQVSLRDLRRETAPLFEAAMRSGNYTAIQEAHALNRAIRSCEVIAKRITGHADGLIRCEDGLFGPSHGRAA